MSIEEDRREAYTALVRKYENMVLRTALAMMKNMAEAEDVTQDVFLKVWEKHPAFESAEHEKAWLLRVTMNDCKSRFRSVWWKRTEGLSDVLPAETPEEQGLIEAVDALPFKYRQVIHLYYYEGYSTAEIAEITEQKPSTVRSLMKRAREKLKEVLEGGDDGEFV